MNVALDADLNSLELGRSELFFFFLRFVFDNYTTYKIALRTIVQEYPYPKIIEI